jgi:Helicase associated domain
MSINVENNESRYPTSPPQRHDDQLSPRGHTGHIHGKDENDGEDEEDEEPATMAGLDPFKFAEDDDDEEDGNEDDIEDSEVGDETDEEDTDDDREEEDQVVNPTEEGHVAAAASGGELPWNVEDDDRKLWQQVLEMHTAGTNASTNNQLGGDEVDDPTRPLHDLAVLAEAEGGGGQQMAAPVEEPDLLELSHMETLNTVAEDPERHDHLLPRDKRQREHHRQSSSPFSTSPTAGAGSPTTEMAFGNKRQRKLPPTSRQPTAARSQLDSLITQKRNAEKMLHVAEAELLRAQELAQSARFSVERADNAFMEALERDYTHLMDEPSVWNEGLKLYLGFKEKHGHGCVPRNPSKEDVAQDPTLMKLSRWVGQNRKEYRKPPAERIQLDEVQIFLLNKLGFDWDPSETKWKDRYEQLKRYRGKHGHVRVPYSKKFINDDEDSALASWGKYTAYQNEECCKHWTLKRDLIFNCSSLHFLVIVFAMRSEKAAISIQAIQGRKTK